LYRKSAGYTHRMMRYLNRTWIKRQIDEDKKHIYPIEELYLVTWRTTIDSVMGAKLAQNLMEIVGREDRGESFDCALVRAINNSLGDGITIMADATSERAAKARG
jgi:cullin 1